MSEKRPLGKAIIDIPAEKIFEGMRVVRSDKETTGKIFKVNGVKDFPEPQLLIQQDHDNRIITDWHSNCNDWYFGE